MIKLKMHTEGLEGLDLELLEHSRPVAQSAVARAAEKLEGRMRQKLSARRGGPSRAWEPPAMEEGALLDCIGRTGPFTKRGARVSTVAGRTVTAAVGVGVGDEATRRVEQWKGKGVNVFEYAHLHEHGGIGADGRRYPPRPYIRTSFEELEDEIDGDWQRLLK